MRDRNWLTLGLLLSSSLGPLGCSTPAEDDTLQKAVMGDLAKIVIYPWQKELATEATAVESTVTAFCAASTEANLVAAQNAWRKARIPWKHAEMVRLGPVEELRLGAAIDFWPVRPDTIEAAITSAPEPVTAEHIAALGTSSKGLPAIEYLLFDPIGGNATILTSLGGMDAAAVKRCDYARALAETFANDAAALEAAWNPMGGAYIDELVNAGAGSKTFTSGQAGIAGIVNLLNASLQGLNENKLSAPLGLNTASPDATLVESRYSDNSLTDLLENLRGVEEIYYGRHGETSGQGLSVLVNARSSAIDSAVKTALTDAESKVSAIAPPLRTAITAQPETATATHAAIRALRIRLSTDVASVLGVSILLNDTDGD